MPTATRPIKGLATDVSGETPTIYIYDEIGPGWLGMIDAAGVVEALGAMSSAAEINVRINSPGGDVFEAAAIYNALARHPAAISIDIDGLAASAASVIAMAGRRVRMAGNALMMIHRAWTIAWGNAEELQKTIETLTKVDETIVNTYAARVGDKSTREAIIQWMAAETWMDAKEAVDRGFADEAGELVGVEAVVPANRYRNVPRGVRIAEPRQSHVEPASGSVQNPKASGGYRRQLPAIAARINEVRNRNRR